MRSSGLILCLLLCSIVLAQQRSVFNEEYVQIDSSDNYSFIISGHFYGNQSNTAGYPANTLLAHLDWINETDACMLVCLGDLFMDVQNDIPNYERALFAKLKKPLFNAVGNHDLSGDIYQSNFGETYFSFMLGRDLHIVLDTEEDNGSISEEQLKLLEQAIEGNFTNVFVYSHRTIWKHMYDEMEGIFEDNTQAITGNNFESEVYPLLLDLSKKSKIYWFSGSMGGEAPASFFHHEHGDITYIATAIRGIKRDAVLMAHVENGIVSFETHSLTGQELGKLEIYDVDFWQENSGKRPFNWRLLPLYIKQTVLSWSFLFGLLSGILGLFCIQFIVRRVKRRRSVKPSH